MIESFSFAPTPRLLFGSGKLSVLPSMIGHRVLLVTGAHSFIRSTGGQAFIQTLHNQNIQFEQYAIASEPTPAMIDAAVIKYSDFKPDSVVAIGGGSALDGGKAISAMLPLKSGIRDYLEGVGTQSHPGNKVPFIAVPTTFGTGSEATRNAVISEIGEQGFKRSLRHDNFVPNVAVVDPALGRGCPRQTVAASGMDAFTQLLESYVSTAASPLTDTLAVEGLRLVAKSLLKSYIDDADEQARTDMAYASYLSGITLTNAGLGLVHGFASPIGGFFEIPHGVVCSTLMAPSNRVTIRKLRATNSNPIALKKYAIAGKIFSGKDQRSDQYYIDSLLDIIASLTREMQIPPLSRFGITADKFPMITARSAAKHNPIPITADEMTEVLQEALN